VAQEGGLALPRPLCSTATCCALATSRQLSGPSFGPGVRSRVVNRWRWRNTRVGFTRNGATRTTTVKTRNPMGIQSSTNTLPITRRQHRALWMPTSHAGTAPRRMPSRTTTRPYRGDTPSATPQRGHRRSAQNRGREISTDPEHAGHGVDDIRLEAMSMTPPHHAAVVFRGRPVCRLQAQ
jgi:hypothetical protein